MTGVTEGDLDLVQRHAHGLGCRLRDDRVGAGADVGHVGLDNHAALAVKPDPRRRLHRRCAAIARGHAHADQPVSFPDLRRPGVALVPVEALRTFAEAAHQVAVGELLGRIAGHDLGLVEDAERDRVETQLLGHFVHRHFQRHVARCFARCASHCLRACRAWRCSWPPGGWRLHRAGVCRVPFSPSSPLILPDQFSWAMAEIRPSFPQPIRTRWRVACRCVVLLGINGRCSAIFTGRPTCLAANAASTASARMNSLPPKPPPT